MAKIEGGSLEWNDVEFNIIATNQTVKAMKQAAIFTQGIAKKMIGGVGSGILYKRGRRTHRASAPGDPPARDTGILANSVSHTVKVKSGTVSGFIGSDIDKIRSKATTTDPEYGLYLELGTPNMDARPWLRPALIKSTPKIIGFFKKQLGLL